MANSKTPRGMNPLIMPDISRHPLYEKAHQFLMMQGKKCTPQEFIASIREYIAITMGITIKGNNTAYIIKDWPSRESREPWENYITQTTITCMICGEVMQILSSPHVKKHGGTREEYRTHFGIPPNQPLACYDIMEGRRNAINKTRIWRYKDTTKKTEKTEKKEKKEKNNLKNITQKYTYEDQYDQDVDQNTSVADSLSMHNPYFEDSVHNALINMEDRGFNLDDY